MTIVNDTQFIEDAALCLYRNSLVFWQLAHESAYIGRSILEIPSIKSKAGPYIFSEQDCSLEEWYGGFSIIGKIEPDKETP